jgi:phosphatidylinositol alpha-1,6-mannosyltransferase
VIGHLLVTNDFPPKHGGIQSYLWELWRRLPSDNVTVLTTRYPGATAWDAAQPFRIVRTTSKVLVPTPSLARHIDDRADEFGAEVVLLDPALPLGLVGPRLRHPYGLVLHGAEVTVPGRLPGSHRMLARVLHGAAGVLAAGTYPARVAAGVAGRALPGLVVPPGVDVSRFRPPSGAGERDATRRRLGLPTGAPLVLGVSRLVPRKGFDVLIDATARLGHGATPGPGHNGAGVHLALAGAGRDRARLRRRAAGAGLGERFHLLGRVSDADLPALYGAADVFAMVCRERWGGLEAEGFGIVFLEAAACATPSVAGRSGGAEDAVVDGETGVVVAPRDTGAVTAALDALLSDAQLRRRLGKAARARAEAEFAYDALAARLAPLAAGDVSVLTPLALL